MSAPNGYEFSGQGRPRHTGSNFADKNVRATWVTNFADKNVRATRVRTSRTGMSAPPGYEFRGQGRPRHMCEFRGQECPHHTGTNFVDKSVRATRVAISRTRMSAPHG